MSLTARVQTTVLYFDVQVMHGDELRLLGPVQMGLGAGSGNGNGNEEEDRWSCVGTVIKVPDSTLLIFRTCIVYCTMYTFFTSVRITVNRVRSKHTRILSAFTSSRLSMSTEHASKEQRQSNLLFRLMVAVSNVSRPLIVTANNFNALHCIR